MLSFEKRLLIPRTPLRGRILCVSPYPGVLVDCYCQPVQPRAEAADDAVVSE